jgi:thymidylate synthase
MQDEAIFRNMYTNLLMKGKAVVPRGMSSLEIENYNIDLPPFVRFTNFVSRNFNLSYAKQEFLWYLKGDRYDTSIAKHAKMWKDLINDNGTINSNYGQYIFGDLNQFDKIFEILSLDKYSRRAAIIILQPWHLVMKTKDIPCTYAISFRIRDNNLNMSVKMRSQDSILGFASDAPCFSFIHEMMYVKLREIYPGLNYGNYYHSVDSFHVYERHFNLIKKIVDGDVYNYIDCPRILSGEEVEFLRNMHKEEKEVPDDFKFTKWLLDCHNTGG